MPKKRKSKIKRRVKNVKRAVRAVNRARKVFASATTSVEGIKSKRAARLAARKAG